MMLVHCSLYVTNRMCHGTICSVIIIIIIMRQINNYYNYVSASKTTVSDIA